MTKAFSITVLFSIWVYVYALFLKIDCFFQAIVMPAFPVAMQRFDFKNSIISIRLYLVLILNQYLRNLRTMSK